MNNYPYTLNNSPRINATGNYPTQTTVLADVFKSMYLEANPDYVDDMSFSSYRNSTEIIESAWPIFAQHVGEFGFNLVPDNQEANNAMYKQFFVAMMTRFYYSPIGLETYDAFLTRLRGILLERWPLYNEVIRKRIIDFWVTHDRMHDGQSQGNMGALGNSSTVYNNESDATGRSSGQTTGKGWGEARAMNTSTPQDELDYDLDNLDYADAVNKNDNKNESEGTSEGQTNSVTKGNGRSDTNSTNSSENKNHSTGHDWGRGQSVFSMTRQLIDSGIGFWDDIFNELKASGLFLKVRPFAKGVYGGDQQNTEKHNYNGDDITGSWWWWY